MSRVRPASSGSKGAPALGNRDQNEQSSGSEDDTVIQIPRGALGNLSYGIVPNAAELQKTKKVYVKELKYAPHEGGRTPDIRGEPVVLFTCLPSQSIDATLADVPDGWTECIINARLKRLVLSTPNFPQPVPHPVKPNHYLAESPGKGMGMFAARDLLMGDLIFAERPIVIVPAGPRLTMSWDEDATAEEVKQKMLVEWEKVLQACFNRVPPELQKAWGELHNSHTQDGSGPLLGVIRTNGFGVDQLKDSDEMSGMYSGVCAVLSRMNHSCSPNTQRFWDMASFSMQLRATRHILKGEEITGSYVSIFAANGTTATRQKDLEPYGFRCTCTACSNASLSDARRAELYRLVKQMPQDRTDFELHKWANDPSLPDNLMLKPLLHLLKLFEDEGLESLKAYGRPLKWVLDCYICNASEKNAVKFGRKYGRWMLADSGDYSFLVENHDLETIRLHPWWGKRKKHDVKKN